MQIQHRDEELTTEELTTLAKILAQQTAKIADAPVFIALLQKLRRMAGNEDTTGGLA